MTRPIAATIATRAHDRVSIAYLKQAGQQAEAGRVYVRDQMEHGYWYVWGLVVKPEYRRQGIGTQLMQEVIDLYQWDRIELIPARDGEDGMTSEQLSAWYARFGFKTGPSANTERPPRPSDERRMYRNGPRTVLREGTG